MKLYFDTSKRIAKKKIGKNWNKLNFARLLKIGDIFSSCAGHNDIIREITPIYSYYGLTKGGFIRDFEIIGDHSNCSMVHCVTYPTWTKDELLTHWKNRSNDKDYIKFAQKLNMLPVLKIIELINQGTDPFDDQGCLK